MPIRRLPEEIVNQIAAGEVVERPASALRELVENALDAGALRIEVELGRGGKDLLVVSDDGSGIPKDEIPLALERHATSKLESVGDLERIATLGFRGEALPSIASVSRFRILSRAAGEDVGWELQVEGGRKSALTPKPSPPGTRVEVSGLFYNTPARRKFLKTDSTELSQCVDLLGRLALVRPRVGFSLRQGGQALLEAPPTDDPIERAAAVLGKAARGNIFPFLWEGEAAGEPIRWEGLLGSPELLSRTASSIYLFVNSRPIRDRSLAHAVQSAYREVLVERKYPTVALNLSIDPASVDVNIHPTKSEVRFRAPQALYGSLLQALSGALEEAPWSPAARSSRGAEERLPQDLSARQERIEEALASYQARGKPGGGYWGGRGGQAPAAAAALRSQYALESAGEASAPASHGGQVRVPGAAREEGKFFSGLDLVGQFHNEYLLCQDGRALYLIDQHAAHERVLYESLRASALSEGGRKSQMLLVPEVLELSAARALSLLEARGRLARLGFDLDEYGSGAILVRAVPGALSGRPVARLLEDAAGDLSEHGGTQAGERAIEELCARVACHGVVRGPTALSPEQARSLLLQMDSIGFAAHCPHGRPVAREFSLADIERMFKRVL